MGWSIATNPALQAPIALANPTGAIGLAGQSPIAAAVAAALPGAAVLSLTGGLPLMGLGVQPPGSSLILSPQAAGVTPRLVTPVNPGAGGLFILGNQPIVTVGSSPGSNLTNGASFSVAGSNFGTKSSLAGEVFFDDMSAATMAAGPWTLIRPFYNSPSSSDGWTEQYRTPATVTPAGDTWGATTGCIVNPATPFRTRYISSACNAVNVGGYGRSSPMFGKVFPTAQPPFYLVASWYEAVSPSWKFGSAYGYKGQGDNNFKWTNYTNSVQSAYTYSAGGSSSQYMYMEWGNSEFTGPTSSPTIDINDDGGTKTGQLPGGGEYHSPNVPSKYYTGINGWVKKEWIAYYTSATTGFIQMAVSQPGGLYGGAAGGTTPGSTRFAGYLWNAGPNGSGQTDGYGNNPQTGTGRSFFLGGFRRNFPQNANRSYWSDIYLARDLNGVGRFVLTDTNSLTTSTIFEWQPYTSWSSTNVTLTCNKGNLASGTVYLWLMDEINGNQSLGPYTMN